MDSLPETREHARQVQNLLTQVVIQLLERGRVHDQSKMEEPELSVFDEYTPKLKELTYDSSEYKEALKAMGPALEHHYQVNRHHPEHFDEGIEGMTLIDLVEMLCDWKAATLRHKDGDLRASLEKNKKRFGISDQLSQILYYTAVELGWF